MSKQPFRWSLSNKRALRSMLQSATQLPEPSPVFEQTPSDRKIAKRKKRANREIKEESKRIREELKRAVESVENRESSYADELMTCCARILAYGGDYDLIFVGRSPESLFDFMQGALAETDFKDRLTLLHFSFRWQDAGGPSWQAELAVLREYFTSVGLHPSALSKRNRPVAFVDLVASGTTFFRLVLLKNWCTDEKVDWEPVRGNIRLIGIVWRQKTSPKAFRWQQDRCWQGLLEPGSIKNVSVSGRFWDYLGNRQSKSTESFSRQCWTTEEAYSASRRDARLVGLSNALFWLELGQSEQQRSKFACKLSEQSEMKERNLRTLVNQIRGKVSKAGSRKKSWSRKAIPYM